MTTIAFKDGVMASDTCVTSCGHVYITSATKLYRTSAGALIGQSGDADAREALALLDKIKSSKQMPTKKAIAECGSDFEFLMAFNERDLWIVGCGEENGRYNGYAYPVQGGVAATGSGWQFAMAAMKCGKSAREAIVVACEFDRMSKLPVTTMSFKKKPPRPKPK